VRVTFAVVAVRTTPVAVKLVGAGGTVDGVTALEAADARLEPCAFLAVTVNV
jgi:hypothetical protein